jgi:hypothetical protein
MASTMAVTSSHEGAPVGIAGMGAVAALAGGAVVVGALRAAGACAQRSAPSGNPSAAMPIVRRSIVSERHDQVATRL